MRVSQWIRQWQLTGAVPDEGDTTLAFWAGWLVSHAQSTTTVVVGLPNKLDEAREMAIRAAEFIEERQ